MKNHLQEIVLTNYLKQYETDVNFCHAIQLLLSYEELNEERFVEVISALCKKLGEVTDEYSRHMEASRQSRIILGIKEG